MFADGQCGICRANLRCSVSRGQAKLAPHAATHQLYVMLLGEEGLSSTGRNTVYIPSDSRVVCEELRRFRHHGRQSHVHVSAVTVTVYKHRAVTAVPQGAGLVRRCNFLSSRRVSENGNSGGGGGGGPC